MSKNASKDADSALPVAVLKPKRRTSLAWVLPGLALVAAVWLGWSAWVERGLIVTVHLTDGHGLEAGDEVRHKGITVGEVRDVGLADDLSGIVATISLRQRATRLARVGTRFWVVRPRVRLTGVEGVETLLGPRYLAALPGAGDALRQRHFVGLEEAPVVESIDPGDLEVIVQAPRRGSLAPGSPVLYRQFRVGTVLSVGLASDGGAVEVRLHVRRAYRQLIRERTRFWDAGGVGIDASITGISLNVESLEAALGGAIALATPPGDSAGEVVRTGHRFTLVDEPDDDWLEWAPAVAIGNSLLPPDRPAPAPLRARIGWTEGRFFRNDESKQGWVLQTERGLLGPSDLLRPTADADLATVVLEVAGVELPLAGETSWNNGSLVLIDVSVGRGAWPMSLVGAPEQLQDCIAIADPAIDPIPLAASRLTADAGLWRVDRGIAFDDTWHGATVVSRESGHVVGMLLIERGEGMVALLPSEWP